MGMYAIGALGTVLSWFMMAKCGRRILYLWGLILLTIVLLITGFLGLAPISNTTAPWVIGSMLLIFSFIYDAIIGPVCYCLVAEGSATRLRSKTIVLARNFYNIVGIANNILTPRMINPTAWDWGAKAGLFWAGSCALCAVWVFSRLPELKGKTYGELDILFARRVRTRDFGHTNADPFHGDTLETRSGSVVVAASAAVEKRFVGADEDKTDVIMTEHVD